MTALLLKLILFSHDIMTLFCKIMSLFSKYYDFIYVSLHQHHSVVQLLSLYNILNVRPAYLSWSFQPYPTERQNKTVAEYSRKLRE